MFNKPYRPVKSEKVKSDKKQATLSSFFLVKSLENFGNNTKEISGQTHTNFSTPRKDNRKKHESFISQTANSHDEFTNDELYSSDASPEIVNFKNPILKRSVTLKRSISDYPDSSNEKNSGVRLVQQLRSNDAANGPPKPAARSLSLLDLLNGYSRKIPKIEKHETPTRNSRRPTSNFLLNKEQLAVLKYVESGYNVFYTGSAGTGKSIVLKEIVKLLHSVYGTYRVGITASTGLAACNIGGQTIHRFLSIGLGTGSPMELSSRIKKNPMNLKKWKALKVLVIDEISMIDGRLFTKLEELARILRGNNLPFGGIQVICTGDFFQLPPVMSDSQCQYCFQSSQWDRVIQKVVLLKQVFRQKGDNELIDMLNALRHGEMDDTMIEKFYKLSRKVKYEDGLEPTELYPTRDEVKRANQHRLQQIKSKSFKFMAEDNVKDSYLSKMLDNLMCEKELELKEGAQVMYLKNLDEQIVNGSIGTVMFFMTGKLWEKVNDIYKLYLLDNDEQVIEEIRLLSHRVGSSESWSGEEQKVLDRIPHSRKANFTKLINLAAVELTADLYPVVKFKTPIGDSLIRVSREEFSIDAGKAKSYSTDGPEKITRSQVPLLLSWALSIHKAQGQTIDRLRIDLKKVFEIGQVYVALSRATNKDHLEILNFHPRRITASNEVKSFYKKIENDIAAN